MRFALKWSRSSTETSSTHSNCATASRISLAKRNAKFGAHQYVGSLNLILTRPSPSTSAPVTNFNVVTDSSISGSVTVPSAAHTVKQFANDLAKIAPTRVDQGDRPGKACVHFGFLRRDPAKVIQARQANVLDDKVEIRERA